jgi:hypothetical protein
MIRFGMWDAILAEPTPDPKLRGLTGGYTYAKTVALAAKGRTDEAKASLVDLERIANAAGLDDTTGLNAAKDHAARRLRKSVDRCGRGTDRIGVLTWMSHDMLAEPEAAPRPRRRVRGLTSWKGPTEDLMHKPANRQPHGVEFLETGCCHIRPRGHLMPPASRSHQGPTHWPMQSWP